ncbi:hypothetical protein [Nostoc edaphicum]|uniref:hypothetical protein n=1 Tax=Nostoc edaphicum TaxID=264686 RepID=UPI001EECD20B|nr:hypothetical protein [Nostoc edaphicum]
MARRSRHNDYKEDLNIWPAFTDLMSNAFMILLLLLLIATTNYTISQISNPGTPPILLIKDENSRFDPGSAVIPKTMLDYIRNKLVPDIEQTTKSYNIIPLLSLSGRAIARSLMRQSIQAILLRKNRSCICY